MIELPKIIGGITVLNGSQNGKFHGVITIIQLLGVLEILTEDGSIGLMDNFAILTRGERQVLIMEPLLRMVQVVVDVVDGLVNFGGRLLNRFADLLGDQLGILIAVLS